ncbi:class A beta-lactamase-related serine hydrolase [Halomonas sp. LR3S48]|uniref:serine hydrolase n=1 Tax=Halomonadaceae TaxID=28256 RepID=UPI0021E488C8|nr:serine hydrolase [Halomonas sp. LR3S48]UYG05474.1 class A beta-lactamase-related serine hydrolase [Halomonas sp. LR3S48]
MMGRRLVRALLLTVMAIPSLAVAQPGWAEQVEAWVEPPWAERLDARLALLEAGFDGELGVHVRDLETGARHGWRDDEFWYLASLVKVPVAIELMARVEAGEMALQERLTLARGDYVDGAGSTNWAAPGSALTLRQLLESMLTVSDNTASDLLMRHLGLEAINARARHLTPPGGLGPITTLVDVRRHAYSHLHPDAFHLSGMDFIELRKRQGDAARVAWLRQRLGLAPQELLLPSIDEAFRRYYATDFNSGRLDAFGDVLEALARGRALGPVATAELLAVMSRTASGERRLKAGLGRDIRLAHKTGTQHRHACDAGIATQGQGDDARRVVIVACVHGELDLARNEQMLAAVGRAVREAGAFEG